MSDHAPAPWEAEAFGGRYFFVYDKDEGEVCHGIKHRDTAYLIAAAPEMLEALKVATTDNWDPMLMSADDIRNIMLAAIRKAEGRDE